jgi:hypothetical protein
MAPDVSKVCCAFNVKHLKERELAAPETDYPLNETLYPKGSASKFIQFVHAFFQALFFDKFIKWTRIHREFAVKTFVHRGIVDTCYIYLL